MSQTSFFATEDEDGFFVARDPARGPWSAEACHGGPVAGLIARSMERQVPDKRLARLTVSLLRPAPMAGLRAEAEIGRNGRSVATASARVLDRDGVACAEATGLFMAPADTPLSPSSPPSPRTREGARPGPFPARGTLHGRPCFIDFLEFAYPPGEDREPGPTLVWMKNLPLIEGEADSPFQSLCALADCGNGISRLAEAGVVGFMNADLTIHMHRPPVGPWLYSQATSIWQPDGIGLARAEIGDENGPVAMVLQSLLLRPTGGPA